MSGELIALTLLCTYGGYIAAVWRGVRNAKPLPGSHYREVPVEWKRQNDIPHARLSHFAWQLASGTRQTTGRQHVKGRTMVLQHIRSSVVVLLSFTLITGFAYPLFVTGVARLLFPREASGSLVEVRGKVVASELIGQQFSHPKYFWGRLSATSGVPYNAGSSSGSNYGPLNLALFDATQKRIAELKKVDPQNDSPVPIDLVTASGSGLDPHISIAAAMYQVRRVARERNMREEHLRAMVERCTELRSLGFLGEPGVNVLRLNLALDAAPLAKGGR
jgi:potassium-transporting ATPase KdpC subunit